MFRELLIYTAIYPRGFFPGPWNRLAVIDLVPANPGCLLAPEEFSWGLVPGKTELSGSEPLQCTVPNRSDVPESKCKVPDLEQEARTVGAGSQS